MYDVVTGEWIAGNASLDPNVTYTLGEGVAEIHVVGSLLIDIAQKYLGPNRGATPVNDVVTPAVDPGFDDEPMTESRKADVRHHCYELLLQQYRGQEWADADFILRASAKAAAFILGDSDPLAIEPEPQPQAAPFGNTIRERARTDAGGTQ